MTSEGKQHHMQEHFTSLNRSLAKLTMTSKSQQSDDKSSSPKKYFSPRSPLETNYSNSTVTRTSKFMKSMDRFLNGSGTRKGYITLRDISNEVSVSYNTTMANVNKLQETSIFNDSNGTTPRPYLLQDVLRTYRSWEKSPEVENEKSRVEKSDRQLDSSNKVMKFKRVKSKRNETIEPGEGKEKAETDDYDEANFKRESIKKKSVIEVLKERITRQTLKSEAKMFDSFKHQHDALHSHISMQGRTQNDLKAVDESTKQLIEVLEDSKPVKTKVRNHHIKILKKNQDIDSPFSPIRASSRIRREISKRTSIKSPKRNSLVRRGGLFEEVNENIEIKVEKKRDYESEKLSLLLAREEKEVTEFSQEILDNIETLKTFIKSEKNLVKQLIFLIGPHFNIYPLLLNYNKNGLNPELCLKYLKDSMYIREAVLDSDGALIHNLRLNKPLMISLEIFNEHLEEFNLKKKQDEVHKRVANIPELFTSAVQFQYKMMDSIKSKKSMKKFKCVEDLDFRLDGINVNRSIFDDLEKIELKSGPLPFIKQDVRNLGRCVEESVKSLQKEMLEIKRYLKE